MEVVILDYRHNKVLTLSSKSRLKQQLNLGVLNCPKRIFMHIGQGYINPIAL